MNDIATTTTLATPNLTTPSKASFKRLADCRTLQEAFETREFFTRISEAAPKFLDAQSMLRSFVQAASKAPLIYQCDYRQAIGAFLTISYLGLVPNTPLQLAHMIPFKSKKWNRESRKMEDTIDLNMVIGYPGYLELAHRSGVVQSVHCDVVLPGEHFRAEQGSHQVLEHRKELDQDTSNLPPRAAYAFVKMRGDADQFEVMSWHEVVKIRNRSQGFRTALAAKDEAEAAGKRAPKSWTEAPWVKDEREMGRKTPFRKLAKWLPKTPELRTAVAFEDAQDHGRLDYGTVIDGDASPLEGIPYVEEPPVDPTSAHGIRSQPDPDDAHRAAEHKAAADRALQARATPPAETRPAPAAAPARAASLDSGFAAVLVDADGEPLDTLYDDATAFARAFMALWTNAGPRAEALIEHNADAIEDAQDDPVAADILLGMQAGAEAVEQKVSPIYAAVEPSMERGKPAWPAYVKALKADLDAVPIRDLPVWVAAQRNVLESCPMAQRMLAVRAIHAKADGMVLPDWLSEMLRAKAAPASVPDGEVEPSEPASTASEPSADEKWVRWVIGELGRTQTRADYDTLCGHPAVKSTMARLRRADAALFNRADRAFQTRNDELDTPNDGEV